MQVWEKATDCSLLMQWNVSYTGVKDCSGRLDRVGARYTATARVLGREIEGPGRSSRSSPAARLSPAAPEPEARWPRSPRCTRMSTGDHVQFELDYELPGGFISGPLERLVGPSVERDIRHSGENFKALSEALVATPA